MFITLYNIMSVCVNALFSESTTIAFIEWNTYGTVRFCNIFVLAFQLYQLIICFLIMYVSFKMVHECALLILI